MRTIFDGDDIVNNILGKQTRHVGEYRLNRYCATLELDNEILVYNGITKEFVCLSTEEWETFVNSEYAIERWYSVQENFNDKLLINQIRSLIKLIKPTYGIAYYTIFTTTQCNARCFYCFEKNNLKSPMTLTTADAVVNFIVKNSPRTKNVYIEWFGGEPLLNTPVIDYICAKLNENDIVLRSSMTSNGFLMTEDMIQRAINNWNLKKIQITLDGTEKTYNRIKNYIHTDSNPYQTVLENISLSLKNNINVLIRLNVTNDNGEDLIALSHELCEKFKGFEQLSVYCVPLYNKIRGKILTDEIANSNTKLQFVTKIIDILMDGGLYKNDLPRSFKINRCSADSDNAIVIFPTGNIGRCNHYLDSFHIGTVYEKEFKVQEKNPFLELYEDCTDCEDCLIYPDCIRPKHCDGAYEICEDKDFRIHKLHLQMLYEYKKNAKK